MFPQAIPQSPKIIGAIQVTPIGSPSYDSTIHGYANLGPLPVNAIVLLSSKSDGSYDYEKEGEAISVDEQVKHLLEKVATLQEGLKQVQDHAEKLSRLIE